MLIFWIYSGLNSVKVIGTEGSARKSLFFYIFTPIFAYFSHFTIFPYVEQMISLSFRLKQISDTKALKGQVRSKSKLSS